MRDLAFGQVGLWGAVSVLLFVWEQHLPSSSWHSLSFSHTPTSAPWYFLITTEASILAVGILLALDTVITKISPTNACYLDFGTTNLVTSLWGRRTPMQTSDAPASLQSTTLTSTSTTKTKDALITTFSLATVTAICQQAVFFHLLPDALWTVTDSFLPAVVVVPPVMFGLFHASSKSKENSVLVPLHLLHGMVYIALNVGTGTLWPGILAQTLRLSHVWTTTWHKTNDQIDWVHAAPIQPPCSAYDANVWNALESHAQGALTPNIQALLSVFYAFDTDQQGYLSLNNVQTAIAFTFWQQGQELPNPTRVKALFETLLEVRPTATTTSSSSSGVEDPTPLDRLSWVEFVRLLVSLRASVRQDAS
jgi:hypothetical protein